MSFHSLTTNNPNGVTNAAPWQTMAASGVPDPTWSQLYYDDFMQYLAALYSVVGTGTPVVAQTTGKGGNISLTTTGAAADTANIQLPAASYVLTAGKHHFFKAKLTPVSSAAADVYAGLFPVGANPLAATDFLGFVCLTGTSTWILRSRVASVNNDIVLPANLTKIDGTAVELGFHVDEQGNIEAFWNPTSGPTKPQVNLTAIVSDGRVASFVNATSGTQLAPTQVAMAPTVGIRTTGAAVRSLTVDFMVASSER